MAVKEIEEIKKAGFKPGDTVHCGMYGHNFTYHGGRQTRCPHCGAVFSPGLWTLVKRKGQDITAIVLDSPEKVEEVHEVLHDTFGE